MLGAIVFRLTMYKYCLFAEINLLIWMLMRFEKNICVIEEEGLHTHFDMFILGCFCCLGFGLFAD